MSRRRPRTLSNRPAAALGLLLALGAVVPGLGAARPTAAAPAPAQAVTPAQQLADAYAPIYYVKRQEHPCDRNGEAYLPAPVEIVFDDPQVTLVRPTGRSLSSNDLIATAPGVADLGAADLGADDDPDHLDFPGHPRRPGCTYETWFRARMPAFEPTTYANVIVGEEEEAGRVVVQYWFWYVFNDFNNTHEGDWEMVQVLFDAATVEEALAEAPVEVGYSQHAGGERADWDDDKLRKEDGRPVVYAAAGSHASNYGSHVYLGWGEDNAGFGCDVTTGPSDRVPLRVVLLPNDITEATGPTAWLTWEGRWGERQRSFYNGPRGPGPRERWTDPFSWQETLRERSIVIPEAVTFGPGPTSVFCRGTAFMSLMLTRVVVYPWLVVLVIATILAAAAALVAIGGPVLAAAWRLYWSRWYVFSLLGLMLIPIGLAANAVQFVFVDYPPGRQIFDALDRGPGARLAVVLTIGGLQQALNYLIVGPSVIEAVGEARAGRRPSFTAAYRHVFRRLKDLVLAVGKSFLIVTALALSVVGIPWAVARSVRWLFVSQAVLLDGATPRQALEVSERAVAGRWWRTAGTSLLLGAVATGAAPVLGIALLVTASPGLRWVNWFSSFVYAVFVPLSVIGLTLLYLELRRAPAPARPAPATEPRDGAAPLPAAPTA